MIPHSFAAKQKHASAANENAHMHFATEGKSNAGKRGLETGTKKGAPLSPNLY